MKVYPKRIIALVAADRSIHKSGMSEIEIFDRQARRKVRDRVARSHSADRWILEAMARSICERLDDMMVAPTRALVIGLGAADIITGHLKARGIEYVTCDSGFQFAKNWDGIQCDEDRLPFRDGVFDMVICCGVLDTVNDLPGALILIRRILKPNAPLIAAFLGAPSLQTFKSAVLSAQSGVARLHPLLEIRTIGDLLHRAGFSMPVVDQDRIDARFETIETFISDLRANGGQNCLGNKRPLYRSEWRHVRAAIPAPISEIFTIINLFAWSPAPTEQRLSGPQRSIPLKSE